jgi:hypothetical protein
MSNVRCSPQKEKKPQERLYRTTKDEEADQNNSYLGLFTPQKLYVLWQSKFTVDSPDFSVEWVDGVPLPVPLPQERTPVVYPYFIRRTKSNNLPVYNIKKHGGSLHITQIQHVEGDPRVSLLSETYSNGRNYCWKLSAVYKCHWIDYLLIPLRNEWSSKWVN